MLTLHKGNKEYTSEYFKVGLSDTKWPVKRLQEVISISSSEVLSG